MAAEAFGERGRLTLRANTCRASPPISMQDLSPPVYTPRRGALHPDTCSSSTARRPDRAAPASTQGWFAVQDQASAFVVARSIRGRASACSTSARLRAASRRSIACAVGETEGVVAAAISSRAGGARSSRPPIGSACRGWVLVQDAHAPALAGDVRPGPGGRAVPRHRIARRRPELLWRPARSDLSAWRGSRWGSPRQPPIACGPAAVSSTRSAPSRGPRPTRRATRSFAHRPELEPVHDRWARTAPSPRVRLWPHRHGSRRDVRRGVPQTRPERRVR